MTPLQLAHAECAEFEASTGASIVSRMIEAGGIVECNWGSFRQHAPAPARTETPIVGRED